MGELIRFSNACTECGNEEIVPYDDVRHEISKEGGMRAVCSKCGKNTPPSMWNEFNKPRMEERTKTGLELIADERKRQIEEEGWTAEHDDEHREEELARAAAYYAHPVRPNPAALWPCNWDKKWAEERKA